MATKNSGTRGRRRFGNTRTLSSGRVQARYNYAPTPHAPVETYKAPNTFEDEDAAIAWLKGQERMIDRGDWVPPEEQERRSQAAAVTVIEYIDLYHDRKESSGEIRKSTVQTYRNTVNNRIRDSLLANIRLPELTSTDCLAWWDSMAVEFSDTAETNRKAYVRLKAAMTDAVERGYIEVNPVMVKAASKRSSTKDKELPTTEELQAIVDNVPEAYRLVAVLCAFHGLRVGEALALRLCDVVFGEDGSAAVWVRGNLQRVKGEDGRMRMIRQEVKTEAGERRVPILRQYVGLIRDVFDRLEEVASIEPNSRGQRAKAARRDERLLSTTRTGRPIMDTSFRSVWNRAREKGGVRDDITPHYGRNWLTVMLAEQGATPSEIGNVLGQRDVSTVVGIYMKVRSSRPADIMGRVSETM